MADRLRDLIDLVLSSLDDPEVGGAELARRASFSRDHLDRLLSAATGETPIGLRRRLLLERAAWQLRSGVPAATAADAAGYGSAAAFSRAFSRAHGVPPSAFAASDRPIRLPAPNGVHFLAPAGLVVPRIGTRGAMSEQDGATPGRRPDGGGSPARRSGAAATAGRPSDAVASTSGRPAPRGPRDLTERMVGHHLARVRELLVVAATLPTDALAQALRPGFVAVWFDGEEPTAALMAERLVLTLEVWVAAILGDPLPEGAVVDGGAVDAGDLDGGGGGAVDGRESDRVDGGALDGRESDRVDGGALDGRDGDRVGGVAMDGGGTSAGDGRGPGVPRPARPAPDPVALLARLDRAGPAFSAVARRVRDAGAWDDAFVDALCEPPQAFTYGGVLSHVLAYGAVRREVLASVLTELGARVPSSGDPIEWEAGR